MRRATRHPARNHARRSASGACDRDQNGEHFHEPVVELTLNYQTAKALVNRGTFPASLRAEIAAVVDEIETRDAERSR